MSISLGMLSVNIQYSLLIYLIFQKFCVLCHLILSSLKQLPHIQDVGIGRDKDLVLYCF